MGLAVKNRIQDEIYSLKLLYNKENIKIFESNKQVIKLFEDYDDIEVLQNKFKKLEYLSKLSFINYVNCLETNFEDECFSYYIMDHALGDQVINLKGYKYEIQEKILVLVKVYNAICEAHEKNILVNDVHGRNFFYDRKAKIVTGIDIDNFQIGELLADEIPDFINRFIDDSEKLSVSTDMIGFGLMILEILGTKEIDLDKLSLNGLLTYIDRLCIKNNVKEELYSLFISGCANMEYILSGLSEETGKVLIYK